MIINPFVYNIELYKNGTKIDDVSRVLNLSVTKKQNSVGILSFSLYVEDDFFEKYTDNTVVVLRRRSLVYGIEPYIEFMGNIVDIDAIEDDNIAPTATIICQDFKGLLARRRILYYQSSQYCVKYGFAESVAKEFVKENIGSLADNSHRFSNGKMPKFNVSEDQGLGIYMEGEDKSGQNLLDVVRDICTSSNLVFDVISNTNGTIFTFITTLTRMGQDLSAEVILPDGKNNHGNIPVVFSFGVGNISNVKRRILNSNKLTAVTAYGRGTDEDREMYTISRNTSESGIDIREEVVNANNESSDGLSYVASRKFGESIVETYEINVIQAPGFIYGYNYSIGDLVTFEYLGVKLHRVVNGVTLTINESGEEEVSLEFEEEI